MADCIPQRRATSGWFGLRRGHAVFRLGLIAYAIPLLSLSLTGLLLLSEPVAALLIDYFWLDKPINAVQWGGAALTLLAIYLGSLKTKAH